MIDILFLAPYHECNHSVILAATTASSLSFLNLFVPFSSRQLFFPLTKHTSLQDVFSCLKKKTISTNAKEDIKGASEIFSYEFIKSTKHNKPKNKQFIK